MALEYYKLSPEHIIKDIAQLVVEGRAKIKDLDFIVYPNVYPSDKFRTTNFILDSIQPLLQNAILCDMGCGMGIIGLFALHHGAKKVVQIDINHFAVQNAKTNRSLHQRSEEQAMIIESDCFDAVPKQIFDLIIFNIPFHSDPHEIENPLEYAFHDPNFQSTTKFLLQVASYCSNSTKIIIAFSNKGDYKALEYLFDFYGFNWILWKIINEDKEYDNRLYQLNWKK